LEFEKNNVTIRFEASILLKYVYFHALFSGLTSIKCHKIRYFGAGQVVSFAKLHDIWYNWPVEVASKRQIKQWAGNELITVNSMLLVKTLIDLYS